MILTRSQVQQLSERIAPRVIATVGLSSTTPKQLADLAVGVVAVETGNTFDTAAKNKQGSSARGLMQVLICTQRAIEERFKYGFAPSSWELPKDCNIQGRATIPPLVASAKDKMFDPEYNLLIGMTNIALHLAKAKGNERLAIIGHNQGNIGDTAQKNGQGYVRKFAEYSPNHPVSRQVASNSKPSNQTVAANLPSREQNEQGSTETSITPFRTVSTSPQASSFSASKQRPTIGSFFQKVAIALFGTRRMKYVAPTEEQAPTISDRMNDFGANAAPLSDCGCGKHP